jgi:CRP-like cAMP-binding protein
MVGNTTLHDALKDHRFTAGLADHQIDALAAMAREVRFAENELILKACEQSKHFYLLLSGSVCVEARMRAYTVRVQELGAGEAFGWSSLLDHHDTLFQVRAREGSVALCLDGADLAAVFASDPELAAEMLRRALKLVAGRVQATEARLAEFCGMRVAAL